MASIPDALQYSTEVAAEEHCSAGQSANTKTEVKYVSWHHDQRRRRRRIQYQRYCEVQDFVLKEKSVQRWSACPHEGGDVSLTCFRAAERRVVEENYILSL
jgi:hypothetical protein